MRRIAQNQREQYSAVRISEHINCHTVNWQASDLCYRQPRDREGLAPCSHEEADSGMMAHIADAPNTYNSIITGTMDSNIVVLAVYAFGELTSSLN